ncbi:unnamed protein product [Allacma fusca]|uniref:Uncharacterized protein n=1 Tax=Allacma fusca TaxID=39272 RepID=A0A8J2LN19_9HEXA|nr:unnamed protein product [Allacma fusca]
MEEEQTMEQFGEEEPEDSSECSELILLVESQPFPYDLEDPKNKDKHAASAEWKKIASSMGKGLDCEDGELFHAFLCSCRHELPRNINSVQKKMPLVNKTVKLLKLQPHHKTIKKSLKKRRLHSSFSQANDKIIKFIDSPEPFQRLKIVSICQYLPDWEERYYLTTLIESCSAGARREPVRIIFWSLPGVNEKLKKLYSN